MSRNDHLWRDEASCYKEGIDTEAFFPEVGETVHRTVVQLCKACPVQAECLAYAVSIPELQGYWAGTYYRDRYKLRKQLQTAK